MKLLIINGPNLNFIGIREVEVYGTKTYSDLEKFLYDLETIYPVSIEVFQSNHEGDLIDKIQEAYFEKFDGIVINPGALTHYSYSLRDAIKSVMIPFVEVHLSDIDNREDFRKISVVKDVCVSSFKGKGFISYQEAIAYLVGEKNGISKKL